MKKVLPLLFQLMSMASFAQTTTTYQSSSGTVSPGNAVTGHLDLGSSFLSPYGMGGGCYYGGCPDWTFSGYTLSYVLPDGTTASFSNFAASANFTNQFDVKVQGTASCHDSTGAFVNVSVNWAWAAYCRSGRGGGCTKKYLGADLKITK